MISESAKSKIILIGEHAVIYGARAIALPCDAYSRVAISAQKDKGIFFSTRENSGLNDHAVLMGIAEYVLDKIGVNDAGLKIELSCDVQPGLGFGLSASLSVALVRALYAFYAKEITQDELLQLVDELENLNHGMASGIDHNVIIHNQPILFQKVNGFVKIKDVPQVLNKEIFEYCYLVNTGKPQESTKEMVEFVAEEFGKSPNSMKLLFDEIDALTPKVLAACEHGEYTDFAALIDRAGVLLEQMGVVSDKVKDFSNELRAAGAAVKISGAGGRSEAGSGLVLVFTKDEQHLKAACDKFGFEILDLKI